MLEHDLIATWSPLDVASGAPFTECTTLILMCRAEPGVIERLLPAPLKPVGDGDIFSLAIMKSKVRGRTYWVSEFGFPCEYDGIAGSHCPLEYTGPDDSVALGRERWHWPKKYGTFTWEQDGENLHVVVSSADGPVIDATFAPGGVDMEAVAAKLVGFRDDVPYLQVKYLAQDGPDAPLRAEVHKTDVPQGTIFSSTPGLATLNLIDGPHDPMSVMQPVEIISAQLDTHEFEFLPGEVIATVEVPEDFDPYDVIDFAWSKVDPSIKTSASFANRHLPSRKDRDWSHLQPPIYVRETAAAEA